MVDNADVERPSRRRGGGPLRPDDEVRLRSAGEEGDEFDRWRRGATGAEAVEERTGTRRDERHGLAQGNVPCAEPRRGRLRPEETTGQVWRDALTGMLTTPLLLTTDHHRVRNWCGWFVVVTSLIRLTRPRVGHVRAKGGVA